MKTPLIAFLFWCVLTSFSWGYSDFVPLRERAQGHSLTGAIQTNDSIYSNPAAGIFATTYSVEGTFAFPKSFSICSVADESLNDEKRHEVAISSNLARIDVGSSVNTIDYFAEALLWQGIGNLPFIFESVHPSCLVDIYRNAPALIVSPGPSLDRNIHLIPSIQNQVLIVAVAQALKALHSVGVTPHIICVVDPQDLRTLFEGVP
ncbi:MAG: DUF115 domain-containing protein, partial [Proteobacteria bacterium]|nr:DUF115 domain-containing protein [Pseudomonadota bacterium]